MDAVTEIVMMQIHRFAECNSASDIRNHIVGAKQAGRALGENRNLSICLLRPRCFDRLSTRLLRQAQHKVASTGSALVPDEVCRWGLIRNLEDPS